MNHDVKAVVRTGENTPYSNIILQSGVALWKRRKSILKIEMKNISKSFGTNKVLEAIDLTINSGEVHALMGKMVLENPR